MNADAVLDFQAENTVIFTFMQAIIATHHSPVVLLEAFNLAHNQFMSGLLADAKASDALIARIEQHRDRLAQRIEHRLQQLRAGAKPS